MRLAYELATRADTIRLVELIRRAARVLREESAGHSGEERTIRLEQAAELDAMARAYADCSADDLDTMMARAVELALRQLDEQIDAGIPRQAQNIDYARIFLAVRGRE